MKNALLPISLAAALSVAACDRAATDPTAELTIRLAAEKTTGKPAEVLDFSVQATGTHLFGVIVRYGDGAVDSVAVPGARTVTARVRHAYDLPGSYTVRAIAEERSGRSAIDSVSIRVESR